MRTVALVCVLLGASVAAGCGYHLAGRGDMLPKTARTIAVQPFGNATVRYKLARLLPADISRELISRTRYRLVEDPGQADLVITGALVNFSAYPIIFDTATGRASSVQAIVNVQVKLTSRADGKVLYNQPNGEYRERYEISVDPAAYFDESGTAMERLSKDVARGVVSAILNAF
jgi:RNase P/RNase MRP subunit p29